MVHVVLCYCALLVDCDSLCSDVVAACRWGKRTILIYGTCCLAMLGVCVTMRFEVDFGMYERVTA